MTYSLVVQYYPGTLTKVEVNFLTYDLQWIKWTSGRLKWNLGLGSLPPSLFSLFGKVTPKY